MLLKWCFAGDSGQSPCGAEGAVGAPGDGGDQLGVASPWAIHSRNELGLPESIPAFLASVTGSWKKGHPSLVLCLLVSGCPARCLAGATTVAGRKRSGTFLMSRLSFFLPLGPLDPASASCGMGMVGLVLPHPK